MMETGTKRTGLRSNWCNLLAHSVSRVMGCNIYKNPCNHDMARPQVADGETATNMDVAANMRNKQSRETDKGWSSNGVGRAADDSTP